LEGGKVVSISTGRTLLPKALFFDPLRLERLRKLKKKYIHLIGFRARDFPAYSKTL
jgi:hypothetical protein